MKCPYCLSDIDEQAHVCKVCTKDLYLFKPMMQKISDLERKLSDLKNQEVLEARILELEDYVQELQHEKDVTIKLWSHNPVNQCAAYNDCCKTHNTEVDKIAFIDTDEFICFDSKYKTIQEVWFDLERQFGRIDHLGAYWRMYGKTEPYFQTRQ